MFNLLKIGLTAPCGKMGRALLKAAEYYKDIIDLSVYQKNNSLPLSSYKVFQNIDELFQCVDVIIDFSSSELLNNIIPIAKKYNTPLLSGTTGNNDFLLMENTSQHIPILWSSNMCKGINIINHILQKISPLLRDYDVEIIEKHHRYKKDAPSGTAITLGKTIAESKKVDYNPEYDRFLKNEKRIDQSIGFASIRGGQINGEHEVMFISNQEEITIKHKALDRSIFAYGAIDAAIWLAKQESNLYSFSDYINDINE
ncbi:MAG: 4-hydroxy-tetrahydrodipicolinate reductase [Anaplasmataceae bacterium]|nr:4-hydroxy-tetrahydrodipicolinate reductase [Anaplasmataceae bacterium]